MKSIPIGRKIKIFIYSHFFFSFALKMTKNSKLILNLYLTSVDESIQTIDPICIRAMHFWLVFVNALIPVFLLDSLQYFIHKQLLKCQSINFNACDIYCIPCILTSHNQQQQQQLAILRLMMIVRWYVTDTKYCYNCLCLIENCMRCAVENKYKMHWSGGRHSFTFFCVHINYY